MWFWRSPLRIVLGILAGFCLVWTLHACQGNQDSISVAAPAEIQSPAVDPSPPTVTPTPTAIPLSPETAAIAASAGPEGLYDPPRRDVRLVVISDLNSSYGSTDYEPEVDKGITLIPFWNPDLVICGGDMVAGQDPSLSEDQLKAMWAAFDAHIAAPLRQVNLPFGFTIGNHDASGARSSAGEFLFERERQVASDYWNAPDHDPGLEFIDRDEFPFYYTFRFNDIFFLTWDGSTSTIPQDKLDWVKQAFESPEAQNAKMRVLIGHLPLYAVATGRDAPGEVMTNADQLREMLEQHQVHTYISGHHHAYYPAHKGNLQLLHMGLLGAGPRAYIDSDLPPRKSLTVVDIQFDSPELTTYTTYDIQTLQPIEVEQLPRFLTGHNGMVLRRDIEMEDLTAVEVSTCENRLGASLCGA
jgi:hypothetical protein